jgi:hypothetical protein
MTSRTWLSLVAMVSALAACGDEPCERTVDLPCDIRKAACRCSVFEETKRARDQPDARLPRSRIISRSQYASEVRTDAMMGMVSEGARIYEASLKVLGLLPNSSSLDDAEVDAQIGGVLAYYDRETRSITLIDDQLGEGAQQLGREDLLEEVDTLAHEYTHALQDQREVIESVWEQEQSTDGLLSVKTLLEGEAMLVADLVITDTLGIPYAMNALDRYDRIFDATLNAIGMSAAPLTEAQLALAYPVGGAVLGRVYMAGSTDAVRSFYQGRRPKSVTGWLDASKASALPGPISCLTPDAPLGYTGQGMDRLGATAVIALAGSLGFDKATMRALAGAWVNDLFALYSVARQPDKTAVAWRLAFSDPALVSMLEAALREKRATLSVTRSDNELLIGGTADLSALAGWSALQVCRAAKSREIELQRLSPELGHWFLKRAQRLHHAAEHAR